MGDALSPVACDTTLGTRLPFEPHGSGAPLLLLLIFYRLIYDFETTEVLSLSKPSQKISVSAGISQAQKHEKY